MADRGSNGPDSRHTGDDAAWDGTMRVLVYAERGIFAFVGALFFIAAFALAVRATTDLWALVSQPRTEIIIAATAFLDLMLLVLMLVELAYTVIVSLRGAVLAAEPFLIVGLIAVIRRILVITIGGVNLGPAGGIHGATSGVSSQAIELGILTIVVLVLVISIVLLRRRPRRSGEYEINGAARELEGG